MRTSIMLFIVLVATGCGTDGPKVESDTGPDDAATGDDTGSAADAGSDMRTPDDMRSSDDMRAPDDMRSSDDMQSPDGGSDGGPDMAADTGDDMQADMVSGDGDTCDVAIDATAGGTFTGDTSGATDDYSASALEDGCPSGTVSGGDIVYRLEPTAETTYDVTVTPDGATYDPFLYVRSDCALDTCIDGTVLNGPGTQESLTVTVPANTAYFVIVDGELASSGAYTLEVAIQ